MFYGTIEVKCTYYVLYWPGRSGGGLWEPAWNTNTKPCHVTYRYSTQLKHHLIAFLVNVKSFAKKFKLVWWKMYNSRNYAKFSINAEALNLTLHTTICGLDYTKFFNRISNHWIYYFNQTDKNYWILSLFNESNTKCLWQKHIIHIIRILLLVTVYFYKTTPTFNAELITYKMYLFYFAQNVSMEYIF